MMLHNFEGISQVLESIDNRRLDTIFKAHILLAEDNIVNQKVALAVFKKLNLSTDVAKDGVEAVKMSKETNYDLIFMDCQMPNMNGFDATITIRKNENDEHIPIIALTANALIEDQEKCMACGMDDFVAKPFKRNDIVEILSKWLIEKQKPELLL